MKRLIIISIAFLLACSEEEGKENIAFKSKLQGTWRWEHISSLTYSLKEITFKQSEMHFKDSVIIYHRHNEKMNGELSYAHGKRNVYYHYNDGSAPFYIDSYLIDNFLQRDTNDVLWIDNKSNYAFEVYELKEGNFTLKVETELYGYRCIGSSTAIFTNKEQTVEFRGLPELSAHVKCFVFNKISD